MVVLGLPLLDKFEGRHADAIQRLEAWLAEARAAQWCAPADIKARYPSASILSGDRVVFDIGGNRFRLLVHVHFGQGIVTIQRVGTHAEYDRWALE